MCLLFTKPHCIYYFGYFLTFVAVLYRARSKQMWVGSGRYLGEEHALWDRSPGQCPGTLLGDSISHILVWILMDTPKYQFCIVTFSPFF